MWHLHLCTCVIRYCASTALACTSAGPVSLKQNGVFHTCHHIGFHRLAHCALQPRSELACFRQWQQEKRSTCDRVIRLFSLSLWRGILCSFFSIILAWRCRKSCWNAYRRVHLPWRGSKCSWRWIPHATKHSRENWWSTRRSNVKSLWWTPWWCIRRSTRSGLRQSVNYRWKTMWYRHADQPFARNGSTFWLNTSPKNYSDSIVVPEDPCPDKMVKVWNSMSRDDDVAGTLLTQMDPVIHLNEGHRSDMLLDLSGLTREERAVVQAGLNYQWTRYRQSCGCSHHSTSTYSPSRKSETREGKGQRHSLVSGER